MNKQFYTSIVIRYDVFGQIILCLKSHDQCCGAGPFLNRLRPKSTGSGRLRPAPALQHCSWHSTFKSNILSFGQKKEFTRPIIWGKLSFSKPKKLTWKLCSKSSCDNRKVISWQIIVIVMCNLYNLCWLVF